MKKKKTMKLKPSPPYIQILRLNHLMVIYPTFRTYGFSSMIISSSVVFFALKVYTCRSLAVFYQLILSFSSPSSVRTQARKQILHLLILCTVFIASLTSIQTLAQSSSYTCFLRSIRNTRLIFFCSYSRGQGSMNNNHISSGEVSQYTYDS